MRKLICIFLFVSAGLTAQVNFSTYGAAGNGVADDTAELQAALDAEVSLEATPGSTFLISSTLEIDQIAVQNIDWNGSTLIRNGTVDWMMHINHRFTANALTTMSDLLVDANDQGGKIIDIKSRVDFSNIEIKDGIGDNINGIRILVYDDPGIYGQSVFDNVDIHNHESLNSDGQSGNNPGMVHGFLVSAQETPSQTTQIVMKNSEIYELWGEDAGGITINSPGFDTSGSPLSFWFENVNVRDAQRRTVKNFIGNTTWINCTFTSAANDNPKLVPASEGGLNPAGLFVMASSSSATGSTNNLVCGCTFQGHPDDPFDSWYTQVVVQNQNGPAGAEIRNSTFTGGHGGRWNANGITAFGGLENLTIANTTFGTTNTIRALGSVSGTFTLDTNNTYADGKSTVLAPSDMPYTELNMPFEACPTIGGAAPSGLTGLTFVGSPDHRLRFDENTVNPTATLLPITDEVGQTYTYAKTGGGNDPGLFSISGDQITLNLTPDFENPVDSNTNNIYACDVEVTASPSGSTYIEDMIFYIDDVQEGGTVAVTSLAFDEPVQVVKVGELLDLSLTFNGGGSTPTDTGVDFDSDGPDIVDVFGFAIKSGSTTFTGVADDTTNGTIDGQVTVTVVPNISKSSVNVAGGQIYVGN